MNLSSFSEYRRTAAVLIRALAVVSSSFFGCVVFAGPQLQSVKGQPLSLRFSDGREAVMKTSTLIFPNLQIPVTISETLCSDRQNIKCTYEIAFIQKFYFFAWSKHSDPSKINQQIKIKGLTSSSEIVMTLLGVEKDWAPILTAGIQPPRLKCDDFGWLPGAPKDAPAFVQIVRWDSEFMLPNPETGVNENRSLAGFLGVTMKRASDRELEIAKIDKLTTPLGANIGAVVPITILGSTIGIAIENGGGDSCQATLRTDLSAVTAKISGLKRPEPSTERQVYIVGADESFSLPKLFPFERSLSSIVFAAEGDIQ